MAYGGAIIHIIYEILKRNNCVNKPFTPSEIINEYNKIKEEPFIIELIDKFKRNNRSNRVLKTLEDSDQLRRWLYKHSKNNDKSKGRSYFVRINGEKYKLKHEFIEILEKELKHKLIKS